MDAKTALTTFAEQFPGFQQALIITSAAVGLMLVGSCIYQFATYHRRSRAGEKVSGALARGMAGAALLGIGSVMHRQTTSIFGATDPRSILDYQTPTGSEAAMLAQVLLGLMTLFGWIGVMKGWLILSRMGRHQPAHSDGEMWNAFVFLLAGTIAANLEVFADIVAHSFGVENYLQLLLGSAGGA